MSVISCRKKCTVLCLVFTCFCLDQPNTPGGFRGNGSSVGTRTYTVLWEAPTGSDMARPVDIYLIKLQLEGGLEKIIRVPHNQTQFTFTDLLPGNKYYASIAASNQVGTSAYTGFVTFTTNPSGTWLCH